MSGLSDDITRCPCCTSYDGHCHQEYKIEYPIVRCYKISDYKLDLNLDLDDDVDIKMNDYNRQLSSQQSTQQAIQREIIFSITIANVEESTEWLKCINMLSEIASIEPSLYDAKLEIKSLFEFKKFVECHKCRAHWSTRLVCNCIVDNN